MLQLNKLMHRTLITLFACATLAFSSMTFADSDLLKTAKAKSEKCVDDTAFMRTNHMEKILHQRDKTLREGVRGEVYSLKECISCHVPENAAFHYGDVDKNGKEQHFCSACHTYAAVTIDCFQCHADRVTADNKQSANNPHKKPKHYVNNTINSGNEGAAE